MEVISAAGNHEEFSPLVSVQAITILLWNA